MKTANFNHGILKTALIVGAVALFSSCIKDGEHKNEDTGVPETSVSIVNASEGSASQELFLDDAKVNAEAVAYTRRSPYVKVNSGNRKAEFKSSGSTTVNASANVDLKAGKHYTIYYTGGASASASYMTEDDMTAPADGKAKVRFVHLSSAATSIIDLAIQGGQNLVNGLAYKTASAFNEINAGSKFNLLNGGSANVALALNDVTLQAGKIYTIYITGSTALSVNYHVIQHN